MRSGGSRSRRSARSPPSRCTSSSTPRSSASSARGRSPGSRSPARCSPSAFGVFNFLAYGTTAAVARRIGAATSGPRPSTASPGCGSRSASVSRSTLVGLLVAPLDRRRDGRVRARAPVRAHVPAHQPARRARAPARARRTGYLRGMQDTRTPLVIAVAANVFNLALEVLFVYGFHSGIAGSAWGTVIAQVAAVTAYLVDRRPRTCERVHASVRPNRAYVTDAAIVGGQLTVRTASLLAVFLVTTAIASRIGDTEVAAHQIALQVWFFLALALDAVAIAAPGDRRALPRCRRRGCDPAQQPPHDRVGCGRGRRRVALFVIAVRCPLLAVRVHRRPAVQRSAAAGAVGRRADAAAQRGRVRARRHPHRRGRLALPRPRDGRGVGRVLPCRAAGARHALRSARAVGCALRVHHRPSVGMGRRYRSDTWLVTGAVRT